MADAGQRRRTIDWALLAAGVAVIYATLPIARWVRDWFTAQGRLQLLGQFPIVILGAAGVAAAVWLLVGKGDRRPSTYLYLALVALAYAVVLAQLAEFAVERLHLIEYGLVGYLAVRCTRHYMEPRWAYGVALLIVLDVGYVDEVIQYFLPRRYYDPRDVMTNALSGLLGLLVVVAVSRPLRNETETGGESSPVEAGETSRS